MRPKRLISLLVAVCMMITMLPLSAVTAFAEDTSPSTKQEAKNGYMYAYTVNGGNATITDFDGPTDGQLYDIDIPETLGDGNYTVTAIGNFAFSNCTYLRKVTIPQSVTSIGDYAFLDCHTLDNVTIPPSVTSIGKSAFYRCYALTTLSLGENIEKIGSYAFADCRHLTNVTIPEKVETIEPYTFGWCLDLKYITLPAGLTSFKDRLVSCPAGFTKQSPKNGAIYYNNDKTAAERLRDNPDDQSESHHILANRNFLYLCKVTFDARGGKTDYPEVPVYKTEKITDTKANDLTAIHDPTRPGYKFTGWYTKDGQPFNVNETAIMEDITLHAGWEFDPNAPGFHPLTVTGGIVTVKNGDKDVTNTLTVTTDETTGKKTYYVPDGAKVTVTLDKTAVLNGKVFDGWSTSLPTGQDCKAESITFTMSSGVNVSATYRDAATDHTPNAPVCHPLTLKDGVITSVTVPGKDGADPEDITEIVKKNANEDGSFHVPEGATVSVAFDKDAFADSGLKFGHWDITGLDDPNAYQDKESFAFEMPAKGVTLKAMTQDASIEDDEPDIVGPIVIGTTVVVGGAVLGYQAYSLGAEFAGKLLNLPYFPSNRSALAMMLWEDAGKPMPESELLYPDVGQEERDMDLQHAARWAMENELIPDLNDEGTAPEEMKFFPANPVSKLDVLNAWQKAQDSRTTNAIPEYSQIYVEAPHPSPDGALLRCNESNFLLYCTCRPSDPFDVGRRW